ncbi:MAG: DUF3047 domain-containing protein [Desulfopila sp.]
MIYSTDWLVAAGVSLKVCAFRGIILFFFVVIAAAATCHAAEKRSVVISTVVISTFGQKDLSQWQQKEFEGTTSYTFTRDDAKKWVLKAHSDGSASGLAREIEVDLSTTPYLTWTWKVEKLPEVEDERTKEGDDYPARIYVIFSTGPWFWDTRALNYVWSTAMPVGASWPNAFTSKARMMAVQSGDDQLGGWVTEKRNVREDIATLFGIQVDTIEGIALMTDADNSSTEAVAYYGEIYFSAD